MAARAVVEKDWSDVAVERNGPRFHRVLRRLRHPRTGGNDGDGGEDSECAIQPITRHAPTILSAEAKQACLGRGPKSGLILAQP